ncbi:MAG TPA: hypothetical protein VMG11_09645, partial [Steroidobacteraceae bacterium]|nr:hypothetical protein [Steroidobacteraceae bacterium]
GRSQDAPRPEEIGRQTRQASIREAAPLRGRAGRQQAAQAALWHTLGVCCLGSLTLLGRGPGCLLELRAHAILGRFGLARLFHF